MLYYVVVGFLFSALTMMLSYYNAAAAAAAAAQTFIYSLQTATDIKCFAWKSLFAAGEQLQTLQ